MEHIKTCREAARLNQSELARKLGISQCAISIMEMPGKYPEAFRLPMIADALDCSIDELFGREPRPRDKYSIPNERRDYHGV